MIESSKQAIVPFLWFNGAAEEAANFYTGIFPDSKIVSKNYYPEGSPAPAGSVLPVNFELRGQLFYALNGGPQFKFTPAISLFVHCSSPRRGRLLLGQIVTRRKRRYVWLVTR